MKYINGFVLTCESNKKKIVLDHFGSLGDITHIHFSVLQSARMVVLEDNEIL